MAPMSGADSSSSRLRWPALIVALSLALGAIAVDTAAPVEAQQSGDDDNANLSIGIPVPYEALDGSESLTVTIDEIIDPFESGLSAHDVDRLSAEEKRYVALRVHVENTAATDLPYFSPNDIQLLDADTLLHKPKSPSRDREARAADPKLASGEIAAGASVEGLLIYELARAAELEAVIFTPARDRLITLSSRALQPTPAAVATDEPSEPEAPASPEPTSAAVATDEPSEPEAPASPGPDLTEFAADGSYHSRPFGYGLTWDPSIWTVREASAGPDRDRLLLEGDLVSIEVEGLGDLEGDARRCLIDRVYADLDVASGFDATPADVLPPTGGDRLPPASGLYLFIHDDADGRSHESVRYVECRTLGSGPAVLRLVMSAPATRWVADRGAAADVRAAIDLPDQMPGVATPEAPDDVSVPPAPPEVAMLSCGELISSEEIEIALAVWERVRAGEDADTAGHSGGEVCSEQIASDERMRLRLEPGDPSDFESGAELFGVEGRPIPGIGDAALLFRDIDGDAAEGTSILSIREHRDVGELVFRLTLGRPDLDSPARSLILAKLARDVLPRFPGIPVPAAGRSISLAEALEAEPPDLSNLSFVANLRAKEEAGEWTRGEGLVATLRYFAGELDSSDVLRDADNLGWEGTGILGMATEYLEDGPEEEAKAEIARLVDLLVWTGPELEAMAGITTPDAAAPLRLAAAGTAPAVTAPFRLAAAGISTPAAGAPFRRTVTASEDTEFMKWALDEACPTFFQRFIDASLPCLKWRTVEAPPGSDGTYRVYVPSPIDLVSPPGGWRTAHYDAAVEAAEVSAAWLETTGRRLVGSLGGPGRMIDVDIVFTLQAHQRKLATAYARAPNPSECSVALYTGLQKVTLAQLKQVIAHELAHCFQYANFLPQIHRVGFTDWWVEGTAEYLSNVIYPEVDFEWQWEGQALRMLGKKVSLLDLSYATFLYWQFLGNDLGTAGIFRLLLGLPTSGGRTEQAERLAASPDMARRFQSFLEAMADGVIKDTKSRRTNKQPSDPPEWTIDMASEGLVVSIFLLPFQGFQAKIHVPECLVADFEVDQDTGQDGARSMTSKGEWGDLPTTLPAGPDDRTRLWLTSATEKTVVKIVAADVDEEDDPKCQDESAPAPVMPCDLCGASGYFFGDSIDDVGSSR